MSIPYPPTSVPYETFVRAYQGKAKKAHPCRLFPSFPAFYPPFTQVLTAFIPPSCATVASMSTFYRFPYRLAGHITDPSQIGCRLIAGQRQLSLIHISEPTRLGMI